eukprot:54590-Prorocentrum_lima.AAC.1
MTYAIHKYGRLNTWRLHVGAGVVDESKWCVFNIATISLGTDRSEPFFSRSQRNGYGLPFILLVEKDSNS